jgi:hypothetical protein
MVIIRFTSAASDPGKCFRYECDNYDDMAVAAADPFPD